MRVRRPSPPWLDHAEIASVVRRGKMPDTEGAHELRYESGVARLDLTINTSQDKHSCYHVSIRPYHTR
jgi:hypothetical protein